MIVMFLVFDWFMDNYEETITAIVSKSSWLNNARFNKTIGWFFALATLSVFVGLICWDIFGGETVKTENLIGLAGLFAYILISIAVSVAPHKIRLRPVVWGFGIQIALGAFVLRTNAGYESFMWLADQMEKKGINI